MALTREKTKGRKNSGHFAAIPHDIIKSKNFQNLSGNAAKLLVQLISELRFGKDKSTKNNGDLSICFSMFKSAGWRSKDTLYKARNELLHYGFIELTRRGIAYKNRPHLFAITFRAIDECNGKLDVRPTRVPSSKWKIEKERYDSKKRGLQIDEWY